MAGNERSAAERGQQVLFARRPKWYVDPETRQIGRSGVAEARKALRNQRRKVGRS